MGGFVISAPGIDPASLSIARAIVDTWAGSGRVVLWRGDPPSDDVWSPPSSAWIEADDVERVRRALIRSVRFDLFLSVSAGTAYSLEAAPRLVRAVMIRHPVSDRVREDVELAMQEAVSNAVVRGSLGATGPRSTSFDDFISHIRTVEERLADPKFSSRRVEVGLRLSDGRLSIEVSDEGDGYDPEHMSRAADPSLPSGRGLGLIDRVARSVTIADGGRRLGMELWL